jgi:hypothetical protein
MGPEGRADSCPWTAVDFAHATGPPEILKHWVPVEIHVEHEILARFHFTATLAM